MSKIELLLSANVNAGLILAGGSSVYFTQS